MKKRSALCFGLLCAVLMLAMTGGAYAKDAAPSVIKIGVLLDLTGPIGPAGIDMEKGLRLAVEMAGAVAGKKVELVVEDVASDASTSMDKARKLVETDKVAMLYGPINAGGNASIPGYAERMRVPDIGAVNVTNDAAAHKWSFDPMGITGQMGYGVGVYTHDVLGYKTAVILMADFLAGHRYADSFKQGFEEKGGKIVQENYYPEGTTNMVPYFTTLKQADVLAYWGSPGDCFAAFPQYRELNMKMPIIQPEDGGVTSSPAMLQHLGKAAIGTVFGTVYLYNANM